MLSPPTAANDSSPRYSRSALYPHPEATKEHPIPAPPPPKRHPYDQWAPDARALDLVGDKWTLLIVRDLVGGPRRFVELQRTLPGISTEQLRSRLNRMVADGLLTRQRYREVPPRVDYELTARARDLLPVIGALARWGYQWTWSDPRSGEAVDIGAIFRSLPGLEAPKGFRGVVQLIVSRETDDDRVYLVTGKKGAVTVEEASADSPAATVRGSEAAWIDALGPEASRTGLKITGEQAIAAALLDGLSAPAAREAAVA
ncbi:winged helix-turn-helix transcriptional regulator [Paraconexibacter antarcticus]|uniref:winged helix-turn-helix transcriptional regulator n=1 Tax=Paraconexibacter antarcticus TaxID=2949664 RepID=UPI00266688BA|nr:helix-turn-helix domain-containing protein [Paraconexibacter antarcticus]